jgi:acyl carrier protein
LYTNAVFYLGCLRQQTQEDVAMENDTKSILRGFITESFLPSAGLDGFEDSDSFMEKGIIDSTGVLELLEFIEEKFVIKVEDEEVIPDNLDSLDKLAAFISGKQEHAG